MNDIDLYKLKNNKSATSLVYLIRIKQKHMKKLLELSSVFICLCFVLFKLLSNNYSP